MIRWRMVGKGLALLNLIVSGIFGLVGEKWLPAIYFMLMAIYLNIEERE
jgi:hypothetical protein